MGNKFIKGISYKNYKEILVIIDVSVLLIY